MKIFATPVPAFFMREKPISSMANPACMKRTSTAAMITHMVFTGTVSLQRPIDGLGEVIRGRENEIHPFQPPSESPVLNLRAGARKGL